MVEPPMGAPAMAPLLDDLAELGCDLSLGDRAGYVPRTARTCEGDSHPHT